MKKTKNTNKIIIVVFITILGLVGYYIYYKNSKTYNEFQESSQLEELIPYDEEKQSVNWDSGEDESVSEDIGINRENIMERGEESNGENLGQIDEMLIVHITGEVKNWGCCK